jgi:hypothetical protein
LNTLDLDVRHGDNSCVHHLFDGWDQTRQVFSRIHDGYDNGLVVNQQMCPVDFGGHAKPFQIAEHGGAGDLDLAALRHDGFIERLAFVSVAFGTVDTKKLSWLSQGHR